MDDNDHRREGAHIPPRASSSSPPARGPLEFDPASRAVRPLGAHGVRVARGTPTGDTDIRTGKPLDELGWPVDGPDPDAPVIADNADIQAAPEPFGDANRRHLAELHAVLDRPVTAADPSFDDQLLPVPGADGSRQLAAAIRGMDRSVFGYGRARDAGGVAPGVGDVPEGSTEPPPAAPVPTSQERVVALRRLVQQVFEQVDRSLLEIGQANAGELAAAGNRLLDAERANSQLLAELAAGAEREAQLTAQLKAVAGHADVLLKTINGGK